MNDQVRHSMTLALSLGVLGGAVVVLSFLFFTPGKYLLIPYAMVVVTTTAIIRAERIAPFAHRFIVGLGAFMMTSIALYVAAGVSANVASLSILGHAWRLGFLLAVGVAVNLPAARIAQPPSSLQVA
jgi:hypothetical protein